MLRTMLLGTMMLLGGATTMSLTMAALSTAHPTRFALSTRGPLRRGPIPLSLAPPLTTLRGGGAASTSSTPRLSLDTRTRVGRSMVVATTCLATHLLSASGHVTSPVQASALVALVFCTASRVFALHVPVPTAAAALSGTFAGMSAHIASSVVRAQGTPWYWSCYASALLLYSTLAGASFATLDYYKIGVGKGGRLGTMAFLANVVYTLLVSPPTVRQAWNHMMSVFGSSSTATLAPWMTLAASSVALVAAKQWQSKSTKPTSRASSLPLVAVSVAKVAVAAILWTQFMATTTTTTQEALRAWWGSLACVGIGCTVVQRAPGLVTPTALVGLVASTWIPPLVAVSHSQVAAPSLYMGAFLGMTSLPHFGVAHFVQAAAIATTLLQLLVWNGFGGRLGLFAYIGVYFAM